MEKRKFSVLNQSRLGNDDWATLMHMTLNVALPLKNLMSEMAAIALTDLETEATPFIEQTNRLRESALTPQINELHKTNVDLLAEIKRGIVFHQKSHSPMHKDAATQIEFLFRPYWDINLRARGTQIKDTIELTAKYKADAKNVANGKTITIHSLMNELESNTMKLEALYLKRIDEISSRGSSGSSLRPNASEAYAQFCNVVESSVNLMPDETLIGLFNNMDALRIKAHALMNKSKEKADEEPVQE